MIQKTRIIRLFVSIMIVIIIGLTVPSINMIKPYERRITVEPLVIVSGQNYSYNMVHSFKSPQIHHEFGIVYQENHATKRFQERIVNLILEKGEALGEDPDEMFSCLEATGVLSESTSNIPCFAQKIQLEYCEEYKDEWLSSIAPRYHMFNMSEYKENNIGEVVTGPCWLFIFNKGGGGEYDSLNRIIIYVISEKDLEIRYWKRSY